MRRRPLLAALLPAVFAWRAGRGEAAGAAPSPGEDGGPPALGISHRPLRFPADHGAHPDTHVEWWYVTGWLRGARASDPPGALPGADAPPEQGFQITFFRVRTGLAERSRSRFAARQLVFAHLALTELAADGGAYLHDQRLAREGFGLARTPAASGEQVASVGDWSLARAAAEAPAASRLALEARSEHFALSLALAGTQPLLLEGEDGWSQKGPSPDEASHYYSEPQLAVRGRLERAGAGAHEVVGRAWLDHEWSDQYLAPEAAGWDWIGINLADGGALMAFRLRRADGSTLWAGGTFRDAAGTRRTFTPDELRFQPVRTWKSPRSGAAYPVELSLESPIGHWRIRALRDDQELDSRASTGGFYWEGLAALHPREGPVAGWGYLELTGYGDRLKL